MKQARHHRPSPPVATEEKALGQGRKSLTHEEVHSGMMDIAFAKIDTGRQMKLALCLALYVVLALLWMPGFQWQTPVYQAAPGAGTPIKRKLWKPPAAEPIKLGQLRPVAARKVPMPEFTPADPEPRISVNAALLPAPQLLAPGPWEIGMPDAVPGPGLAASGRASGKGAGEGDTYRVDVEGLIPPVITHRVPPRYPPEAVKTKVEGYVILTAVLRKDGVIDRIGVLRNLADGQYGFEREAEAALKRWTFLPGRLDGKAVDVRLTIKIDFILY